MKDETVISLCGVSKLYKVYARPKDIVREFLTRTTCHTEFWALKDVTLDVRRGEVVGVIGRNGAGKSTLLRVIAGILEPTGGTLNVAGRVSTILELGTGFHPACTGRENIHMAGLCLGLSRKEITNNESAIIEFSGIGEAIDQPLRTYSAGMQSRLAFSIAFSAEPDIFVVDEGLAVGDAQFQRKCFAKFQEIRMRNKTVLFVSHEQNAINHLCDRVIWIDKGRVVLDGQPREVSAAYAHATASASTEEGRHATPRTTTDTSEKPGDAPRSEVRYGNQSAEILECGVQTLAHERVAVLRPEQDYDVFLNVRVNRELRCVTFGFRITTIRGVDVFAANSAAHGLAENVYRPGEIVEVRFRITNWLGPGHFFLTFGVRELGSEEFADRRLNAVHVQVIGRPGADPKSLVNLRESVSVGVVRQTGADDTGRRRDQVTSRPTRC